MLLRHFIHSNHRALSTILNTVRTPKPIIVQSPETKITTLNSGLRIASETIPCQTATVGVWIDGGSRYETERNNGGTRTRSQMDLELEVENIGAHLNAYTSREHTVYFAKCFGYNLEKAVEILSDILLDSVYGKREIENERGVILREMEEIEQNLQEVVFDYLHAGAYQGCSLSRTILGPVENIRYNLIYKFEIYRTINREDMRNYIKTFYKGQRMFLCAAGGVDHNHLVQLGEKYFGRIEKGSAEVLKYEPGIFQSFYQVLESENMQSIYGCLAVEGTSWTHPDNLALQVVNTMLGQFDRSQAVGLNSISLLADALGNNRTESGVENFMSFTTSYKDTGLTGIYFVLDNEETLFKFTELVTLTWRSLCTYVDPIMLERAKRSLYTNMLVMLDGTTPICEDIGRQLLCYGRRITVPELEAMINAITPETIQELACKYFVNCPFAYMIIGGKKGWPRQEKIANWLKL